MQRRRKKLVNPLEKSRLLPTGSTPQSQKYKDFELTPHPSRRLPPPTSPCLPVLIPLADQISEVQLEDQTMFEHDTVNTQTNNHPMDSVSRIFQAAAAPTPLASGSGNSLQFDSERNFGANPGKLTPHPSISTSTSSVKCSSRSPSHYLQVQS